MGNAYRVWSTAAAHSRVRAYLSVGSARSGGTQTSSQQNGVTNPIDNFGMSSPITSASAPNANWNMATRCQARASPRPMARENTSAAATLARAQAIQSRLNPIAMEQTA